MRNLWKITRLAVVLLSILIFTPLVIPDHVFKPEIAGLPYTLWTGILVYIGYVALIMTGIFAHSRINREGKDHD
jgi:hypothetical protein